MYMFSVVYPFGVAVSFPHSDFSTKPRFWEHCNSVYHVFVALLARVEESGMGARLDVRVLFQAIANNPQSSDTLQNLKNPAG